ncbi:MAG: CapA family protein [Planctomycetota bacterium]
MRLALLLIPPLLCIGCATQFPDPPPGPPDIRERPPGTGILLQGSVLDDDGQAVAAADLELQRFRDGRWRVVASARSGADGIFSLPSDDDRNALLLITAPGHYGAVVPLDLQTAPVPDRDLGPIELVRRHPERIRLALAGDTMFGRRFEDPDDDGEAGDDDALIQPGSRAEDAAAIGRLIAPLLADADYRVANFESTLTTREELRHPYLTHSFRSHPETVAGLQQLLLDAVSLGNNHIHDFGDQGTADTLATLADAGIPAFGAGMDASDAAARVHRHRIRDMPLSWQGFNGNPPFGFPAGTPQPWPPEFMHDASDDPPKAGSLALTRANLESFMRGEDDQRLRIPVLHGGHEYGEQPSPGMQEHYQRAVDLGAPLVVAHHPHTLYGFAIDDDAGAATPAVVLASLGNLIFDQDVFETFPGAIAIADIDRTGPSAWRLHRLRLRLFHQEDYVPAPLADPALARHLAHLSTFYPTSGAADLRGAVVVPDPEGARVCLHPDEHRTRRETIALDAGGAPSTGRARILAVPQASGGASLRAVHGSPEAVQLGRDLLRHGSFEDRDVDAAVWENTIWTSSRSHHPSDAMVRSGRAALVLYRHDGNDSRAHAACRFRISYRPDAALTLSGWYRRSEAGRTDIAITWILRDTRFVIDTETVLSIPPGSDDGWVPFAVDLRPPSGSGHLRLDLRMDPQDRGHGSIFLDDCALIDWQYIATAGAPVPGPNDFGFLRLPPEVDQLQIDLLHHRPAAPMSGLATRP